MPDVGLLTPGADLGPGSPVAVTDDVAVLRALLAAEAAWVRAQARCGVVPAAVASVVDRAVVTLAADDGAALALATEVARDATGGGNPVIPLVARLRAAVESGCGPAVDAGSSVADVVGAVHAGLTSQDVLDTALVLVLRDAGRAADAGLGRAVDAAAGLARRYRDLPALGRTLTQPAVPTTLGARCAGWLQAVAEARARLADATHALPLAFGGAAGTLAGTDALTPSDGPLRLVDAWAAELGLPVTPGPWHVTRFPVVRAAAALAEVCAALGTVAADVLVGARAEVGELREPAAPGRGASSAMAHKRNPVLSVLVRRSALAAPALASQVLASAGQAVDERPDGAWHAEWPALQQLARHAVASAHAAAELLDGLEVDTAAVARHLREQLGVDADVDTGAAATVVDRVLDRYAPVDGSAGSAPRGTAGR
ncbi:lyase family protein [Isoptericola sp. 4D.3]|uniref:Lyase family protein n=1 Tax=Isoptericola peretonis TaxID=2918523 RepID=A0ABT0J4Q7_9MICO|nr:lyase family protein [Isoptericola sp. 4D.3]